MPLYEMTNAFEDLMDEALNKLIPWQFEKFLDNISMIIVNYEDEKLQMQRREAIKGKGIEEAPTIKKQGKWILVCDAEGEGDNLYRCSVCGHECGCQEYDLPNYCGTCGARMKGAEDGSC